MNSIMNAVSGIQCILNGLIQATKTFIKKNITENTIHKIKTYDNPLFH